MLLFSLPALIFLPFPLNQQLSRVLFAYKNKTVFWQINKFLKMFIISGLQKFGLHRNMQNKVELFDRGPGQKMGCNKFRKNLQMGCKLLKK